MQRGEGPLVVGYLLATSEASKARLRQALPGFAIVITGEAPRIQTDDDLADARALAGSTVDAPLVLVGWSKGCQTIRTLLEASVDAAAVVCADGTHDTWPHATHLPSWIRLAERARREERCFVASCSQQTYVEELPDAEGGPFMATVHVLEAIVGRDLPPDTEVHEGGLHVFSCASERIDRAAHERQQTEVLPELLGFVAAWFDDEPDTLVDVGDSTAAAAPWEEPVAPWREVARVVTPITELELLAAVRDGHRVAFGTPPSPERLGIAWAQLALETGRGARCNNNNIGNLTTGKKWLGDRFTIAVPPPDPPKLTFRAYSSPLVGASDYWVLIFDRFPTVLPLFDRGDAIAAAVELGRRKYFLAPVTQYAKGMSSLYAEGLRRGLFGSPLPPAA